jgi:hypothetical protein
MDRSPGGLEGSETLVAGSGEAVGRSSRTSEALGRSSRAVGDSARRRYLRALGSCGSLLAVEDVRTGHHRRRSRMSGPDILGRSSRRLRGPGTLLATRGELRGASGGLRDALGRSWQPLADSGAFSARSGRLWDAPGGLGVDHAGEEPPGRAPPRYAPARAPAPPQNGSYRGGAGTQSSTPLWSSKGAYTASGWTIPGRHGQAKLHPAMVQQGAPHRLGVDHTGEALLGGAPHRYRPVGSPRALLADSGTLWGAPGDLWQALEHSQLALAGSGARLAASERRS